MTKTGNIKIEGVKEEPKKEEPKKTEEKINTPSDQTKEFSSGTGQSKKVKTEKELELQ